MRDEPELIVNLNCIIGEGPVWDAESQTIYWVDLLGNMIHSVEYSQRQGVEHERRAEHRLRRPKAKRRVDCGSAARFFYQSICKTVRWS